MATSSYNEQSGVEEIEQKVISAFKIFDYENDNSIDARDVGAAIRYLGCCPTEADLAVLVEEIQEGKVSGFVQLDNFVPIVTKLVEDNRHKAATYDQLLEACRFLDTDRKGYFSKEELKIMLTTLGEPFSESEMEELNSVLSASEDKVTYSEWITWLVPQMTTSSSK